MKKAAILLLLFVLLFSTQTFAQVYHGTNPWDTFVAIGDAFMKFDYWAGHHAGLGKWFHYYE